MLYTVDWEIFVRRCGSFYAFCSFLFLFLFSLFSLLFSFCLSLFFSSLPPSFHLLPSPPPHFVLPLSFLLLFPSLFPPSSSLPPIILPSSFLPSSSFSLLLPPSPSFSPSFSPSLHPPFSPPSLSLLSPLCQNEMESLLVTQEELQKGSLRINQMLQEMENKQVPNVM